MAIQSVPLSSLQPPAANPRTIFDAAALDGLAASIKADGLLQNLVVAPAKGKGRYRVVSGERRFRALKLLAERGDIDADYEIPVEIRSGLSKDDTLRLATIENLQREDLPPLDQAAALAALIRKGTTLEDLIAKTGLSATTIKRRLALNSLCDEAVAALREHAITLAQAEALTLGDGDAQREVLEQIESGYGDWSGDDIRTHFLDDRPSLAMAIFPLDQYTGTLTTDLFRSEEASYFDDAEQFMALQTQAVERLSDEYRGKADWVEVTNSYRIPDWQYDEAEDGQPAGVVINLAPSGRVEIREGLARPERLDRHTAQATADAPLAPVKRKPAYPTPLRRYIAWHKSLAVQEVLLADPRRARDVAAVAALRALKPHEALRHLAQSDQPQIAYQVIETQATAVVKLLKLEASPETPAWETLASVSGWRSDARDLYERVKALSDAELAQLEIVLAVIPFGQESCERLDSGDTLFNAVAQDLKIDMRQHWRADADFLNRRSREQLVAIAQDCGYADGVGGLGSWKKSELLNALLRHFEQARQAASPTEAQRKALAWLPDAMLFPAVDPDAETSVSDDEPPFAVDDDGVTDGFDE